MSSIYPERRPDVGIEYEHPQGSFEQRVGDLIDKRLRDPLGYPTEMRAWLPMWVSTEMQLPVTNVYGTAVLDNYTSSCTSTLTLTTSYQTVPGLSITLRKTGVYLVITTMLGQITAGATSIVCGPLLDGAELAPGSYLVMSEGMSLGTVNRSDITTVGSLASGGVITATALKSSAGGAAALGTNSTKIDAIRIGGIGAT